jgi:UAA transporter family
MVYPPPTPFASLFFLKIAVAVVSSGVIIATLSRPRADPPITITRPSHASPTDTTAAASSADASRYTLGIAMLLASLVCTGVHGALQERTYSTYGPCWREGIFYTVRTSSITSTQLCHTTPRNNFLILFFWGFSFFLKKKTIYEKKFHRENNNNRNRDIIAAYAFAADVRDHA